MKLCVDCKYFKGSSWCKHPSNGISPVDGKPNGVFASMVRSNDKKCGEQGSWHEECPAVQPSSWLKLFLE